MVVFTPCRHIRPYSGREHRVFKLIQSGDNDDDDADGDDDDDDGDDDGDDDDDDDDGKKNEIETENRNLKNLGRWVQHSGIGYSGPILAPYPIRVTSYNLPGIQWIYSIPGSY